MDRTEQRIELALKKQRLLLKSAQLRQSFAEQTRPLIPLLTLADKIQSGIRWLKHHPALPVAILTALLVARPRTTFRWLRRGWLLWQTLRPLRSKPADSASPSPPGGVPGMLLKWLPALRTKNRA